MNIFLGALCLIVFIGVVIVIAAFAAAIESMGEDVVRDEAIKPQRPCAGCQRYQRLIALAKYYNDEHAEVAVRQEFQRHLATGKHAEAK